MRQADFIFKGTVEKLQASNVKYLPATDRTALVRVTRVIYAQKTLMDFTGQDITVYLAKPGSIEPRQQEVFFTKTWLFGDNLAVIEIGHIVPEVDLEALGKQSVMLRQEMENERIQARIQSASLVVMGKVASTRPLEKERNVGRVTEHDPNWWVANVEVQTVLKGSLSTPYVNVVFPSSGDVMWKDSPKFFPNQGGIWILQSDKSEGISRKMGAPVFATLDPLDFQHTAALDQIKGLIAKTQK